MNDIVINKIQSIQRCIVRARDELGADPTGFAENYTRQDAAVLNVLRACEQSIDLANHLIKTYKMGIPTASADSFALLQQQGVIDDDLRQKLASMVHFRNTIIHQYQRMDIAIVQAVIKSGLDDLIRLGDNVMAWLSA
ncbi:Protein of unknown function DUF86, SO_3166 group [hydrothermal vent metagenome]|uniref:DUF86 domain-containing protein n=1 Tax=hydrothermal vent metagenome TaxID=652676 RepID=A0A3B0VN22_9ZZZZ